MGGELRVNSRVGEGSRFHFELTLPEAPARPADAVPMRPGLRVLIVDDNPMAREVLQAMGEGLKWDCELASSGEQALALVHLAAERGKRPDADPQGQAAASPPPEGVQASRGGPSMPYDLILMDWRMPGLDGWETSRRIRDGQKSDAPVIIMVTAHGRELLAERSEREIASLGGYLVKPVTASTLQDAVAEATRSDRRSRRAEGGLQRLTGLRLLVVEDNGVNQQVAQELLEDEGAIVTVAGGGVQGAHLAVVTEPPFDAVLMDLQMPDIDGFEATQRILRRRPESLVIAMTANAMDADRQACMAAGMRDHIAKPVDLDQLVASLRRHVAPVDAGGAAAVTSAPPLLDRAAALQRLGGRQALYDRLVISFIQDVPTEMDALRGHLRLGSVPDALRVLHTLRGLAGAVGADALAAVAGAQEQALRDRADVRAADVETLQRQLDDTLDALVPPQSPAVAAEPVDPLQALRRLRQLLVERNMRSVTACEQLAGQADVLGPDFATLSLAIARLDFAKALKACDLVLQNLNPR